MSTRPFGAVGRRSAWILACGVLLASAPVLALDPAVNAPAPRAAEASASDSNAPRAAESAAPMPAPASEQQARLAQALERYARALTETDRDRRLADFARAERGFAALAADGVDTPALWTNLGNAALQAQHPGQAVLAYHRALRLDPADAKAMQNLNHVRSGLPSWVPHPESADGAKSFSLARVPAATRSRVAAVAFLAMALCVLGSVRRREGAWRGLAILAGIVWVGALASTLLADDRDRRVLAVTTAEESFARTADSSLASLAYPEPLPPGVEVELLEDRADWVRVRLANGRDIWLRASSVTAVAPEGA